MSTTIRNQAAKRSSLRLTLLAATAGLALAATPALAAIEDGYEPGGTPATTTWYGPANPAALKADRDYVAGMRHHHAGALTMAQEYLADPQASSPVLRRLAHAIIRNQRFEIGLLDEVARNLDRPPVVVDLGILRFAAQSMATEGLGQRQRFLKSPIPSPLAALGSDAPVTARDVQFAKGMTVHHQAALDMARAYNADQNARNTFLRLMNVDIVTDQSQEIALMRSVVAAYPGDPNMVQVDASAIHGMEAMQHGGGHAGHGAAAPPQAPASAPAAQSLAPQARAQAAPHGQFGPAGPATH
ncbi:DUF305 domain-containing protein [Siccirubricoccus sp. G192]|uniref:DUF305 domain-containing protein n=1 Tax=Siccirubricoccus sp. G192 TaxID=2849651 RepID=UPI001C2C323B|nr:DUF305 domain-containing protein [Siccirubricoccus sp. G192]MBV1795697.1 DUF305 domain-containing protein [Siccirubricoccus sp. G192]